MASLVVVFHTKSDKVFLAENKLAQPVCSSPRIGPYKEVLWRLS